MMNIMFGGADSELSVLGAVVINTADATIMAKIFFIRGVWQGSLFVLSSMREEIHELTVGQEKLYWNRCTGDTVYYQFLVQESANDFLCFRPK